MRILTSIGVLKGSTVKMFTDRLFDYVSGHRYEVMVFA